MPLVKACACVGCLLPNAILRARRDAIPINGCSGGYGPRLRPVITPG